MFLQITYIRLHIHWLYSSILESQSDVVFVVL